MGRIKKASSIIIVTMVITGITALNLDIFTAYGGVPGIPHDANAMWIEPESVELSTDTHTIGYKFNVTLWINLSVACTGWQFKLLYNKNQLDVTRFNYLEGTTAGKSQFFENITTMPVASQSGSYNDTHDFVLHGEAWIMGVMRKPGYGGLEWVEFEVIAAPDLGETLASIISISTEYHPPTSKTYALDQNGQEISLTVGDCSYRFTSGAVPTYTLTISSTVGGTTNPSPDSYQYAQGTVVTVTALPDSGYVLDHWELDGSYAGSAISKDVTMDTNHTLHAIFATAPPPEGTKLYVDPPEIIAPEMNVSSTFTINITIYNVTDLKTCEFNLTYNTDILGWVSVRILRVQGQMPTASMMLDDDIGFIWVKLKYQPPITTETAVPLVTIEFHVEALGATPLAIRDTTKLTDSAGDPITHTAFDGFFATLIRDVAVIDVYPSRSWAYQGWEVNITIVAKNEGNVNETFNVLAYYDATNLIGNTTIKDLPPGNETTIIFTWNTENVTYCHNYTISGQASIVPYELDTADNEYVDGNVYIRILGDVNGNGTVDIKDIVLAAEAAFSYPGHPSWNPAADLDQNLFIDIRDIVMIAVNFGKSC